MTTAPKILTILLIVLLLTACVSTGVGESSLYRQEPRIEDGCSFDLGDELSPLVDRFADRLESMMIKAPLDWDHREMGEIDLALLIVKAGDPLRRKGTIVFNPGGPGGDGLAYGMLYAYLWGALGHEDSEVANLFHQLTEEYDLVGFSPRGTGASTRLESKGTVDIPPGLLLSADRSQENLLANRAYAKLLADILSADRLLPYIDTESTARDLDLIRHLLGEERLNYVGISWGVWLGTWYASLFPDRVGRLLFIGNTDITTPLADAWLAQDRLMQRVWEHVIAPFGSAHPSLFGLGDDAHRISSLPATFDPRLRDITARRLEAHIAESVNAPLELLTLKAASLVDAGLQRQAPHLLKDWIGEAPIDVAEQYEEVVRALALEIASTYLQEDDRSYDIDAGDAVFWAVVANDGPKRYEAESWAIANTINAKLYPTFGGYALANPGIFWEGGEVGVLPTLEPIDVPALLIQSEFDPFTPIEGALRTLSLLPEASMIVLDGEYQHCPLIPYGNERMDTAIARWLGEGILPERLSTAEGIALESYL